MSTSSQTIKAELEIISKSITDRFQVVYSIAGKERTYFLPLVLLANKLKEIAAIRDYRLTNLEWYVTEHDGATSTLESYVNHYDQPIKELIKMKEQREQAAAALKSTRSRYETALTQICKVG